MGKPQLPPYVLQILTHEYLIEGTIPGDTDVYFPKPNELGNPIPFESASITPTRSAGAAPFSCNKYVVTRNESLIFIPRTDYTQLSFYSTWKQYQKVVNGKFHLGHYWMTGRLMAGPSGFFGGSISAYDVCIGSMVPGLKWGEITAPFALINSIFLHGWEVE
jgi:hypothetical protein